jgi:hypothetical protein
MKEHSRKIVYLVAALLALFATAADAGQRRAAQAQSGAQSGMQTQQQSAAGTQQLTRQRQHAQQQDQKQQRIRQRERIHATDPAARGQQSQNEGDGSG